MMAESHAADDTVGDEVAALEIMQMTARIIIENQTAAHMNNTDDG